jgi:hypothetical protein
MVSIAHPEAAMMCRACCEEMCSFFGALFSEIVGFEPFFSVFCSANETSF